jgi:hypothetical protein
MEPDFHDACFRPVVETKTDIAVFEKILDGVNRKQPVVA